MDTPTPSPTTDVEPKDEERPSAESEANGGAGDGEQLTDEQLQKQLAEQRGGLKDVGGGGDSEPRAGAAAVAGVRDGRVSKPEASSALDWFLNEDPRAADTETMVLELNFGTQDEPRWISWTIKPVAMEIMRAIRRKAANTRLARTTGEVDEYRVNLEIVVEGTVDPDVREAARVLAEEKRGPGDPVDALRAKFQSKPGYVAQLAGQIMTLSGFNDEDVREAEKAAKN